MKISDLFLLSTIALVTCLLSFGYYLEYFKNLYPCLFCVIQRFCYLIIGCVAIVSLTLRKLYGISRYTFITIIAVAFLGAAVASRQVWLQRFADSQNLECGASLRFLIDTLPLSDVIYKLYLGSSDCATVHWALFGWSIADWSLFFFLAIATSAIWVFLNDGHRTYGNS